MTCIIDVGRLDRPRSLVAAAPPRPRAARRRSARAAAVGLVLLLGCLWSGAAAAGDPKIFAQAKDAFGRNDLALAAHLSWQYLAKSKAGEEKYESAQFFLASALEKLGYTHAAVEYYYAVANNRQTPELLPRAIRALEAISLEHPLDEGLILRDLIGDTDFGDLPTDLADFAYYWQGITNMERHLHAWASERFAKISHFGYYHFSALYVASIRVLGADSAESKQEAAISFAHLFGPLDLGSALDALRRRGEADSKLAYTIKAIINDDNVVALRYDKLPKGWEVELALLGMARVEAETGVLVNRARDTDEEQLGMPLSYNVQIGGMPIYSRAIPFEERAGAIRSVAARLKAVRAIRGKALHTLARLLFEQKQFAAAYTTLGSIPRGTELGSEILLERAWSKYKAGDPHRAMGLLYALDAPIFRKLFGPEKYLLRGLIYRRFCHFRAAKLAARRFRSEYGATLQQIRDGKPLDEISKVREAALRRIQSMKMHLFVRSLRQENAKLDGASDEWRAAGLYKHLRTLYRQKIEQMKAELGRSLEDSTREVAEEMLDAEEQVNLLEYEVGQAIFQRVSESAAMSQARKAAPRVPISADRVYYKFGGEYWTDELPHYKFNIEDRCVE